MLLEKIKKFFAKLYEFVQMLGRKEWWANRVKSTKLRFHLN
jgi:hypothetical protein